MLTVFITISPIHIYFSENRVQFKISFKDNSCLFFPYLGLSINTKKIPITVKRIGNYNF